MLKNRKSDQKSMQTTAKEHGRNSSKSTSGSTNEQKMHPFKASDGSILKYRM